MAANVTDITDDDKKFMAIAMEELRESYKVGGIPVRAHVFLPLTLYHFGEMYRICVQEKSSSRQSSITLRSSLLNLDEIPPSQQVGAALVSADGTLLGQGRNLRVQEGSAIKHVSPTHSSMSFAPLNALIGVRPKLQHSRLQLCTMARIRRLIRPRPLCIRVRPCTQL